MKIGFFCNEFPPRPHGGIGTFVQVLVDEFVRRGHDVTVVQWGTSYGVKHESGVRIVTLVESFTPRFAWLVNRVHLWRWLRAEVIAGRIEVFEIPDYQGCLPFPLGVGPVVVRLHLAESFVDSIMVGRRGNVYFLEKLTLYWHPNWIGVSGYILNETRTFFRLTPRYAKVIYNPAPVIDDDRLFCINCQPAKYIVYVGTVSERKGALLLADAMRDVFATHHDVSLVYVGAETEHNGTSIVGVIRNMLSSHADRIVFTGRVTHIEALSWMRNAIALAFVSRVESFGLVVTEAMALGIPVICAATGPGPELVDNDLNGTLIRPDSKSELAQAIIALINDPKRAATMGAAGRRKALNEFSLTACANQTLQVYTHLLRRQNGNFAADNN